MNDKEFEELLKSAARGYRVPPDAPLETIWQKVEAAAFGTRITPLRRPSRALRFLAFAATLVLGIGLGWGSAQLGRRTAPPSDGAPRAVEAGSSVMATIPSPFVGVAGDYLQRTTALLAVMAGDATAGDVVPGTIERARELLSTTRLLLDAGVPDPGLKNLLEDLELVLAQIARLPEQRPATDAQLITNAMAEREVLPRLALLLTDSRTAP